MNRYDYLMSLEIAKKDYPFYALIMAAMRQADSNNLDLLRAMWPAVWDQLEDRYNAPGGYLPGEMPEVEP